MGRKPAAVQTASAKRSKKWRDEQIATKTLEVFNDEQAERVAKQRAKAPPKSPRKKKKETTRIRRAVRKFREKSTKLADYNDEKMVILNRHKHAPLEPEWTGSSSHSDDDPARGHTFSRHRGHRQSK